MSPAQYSAHLRAWENKMRRQGYVAKQDPIQQRKQQQQQLAAAMAAMADRLKR